MKQYDRVEELALNFTVVNNDLGETQVGYLPHWGVHKGYPITPIASA